ncbi:MAG: hypothetical protein Q9221_008299 [Calogaya cf. arnoldii]
MLVQSEGQAPYEEEVEMHDTDVIQIVEQTEEPIPHEPEIRQGETNCPAQPLAQSGNDEVDEPLEVIEAPCEKFSLPLGSQAERLSLTRHEPYRITSPATEQNQEVTLPKQNVFEMWNKECGEDDWIGSFTLKQFIAETADDFYYAIYDKAKGKLQAILVEKVYNWSKSKSKNRDGVIYIFRKLQEPKHAEIESISFDTFRGASTKIRLELIQASTDISLDVMQASKEKRIAMI